VTPAVGGGEWLLDPTVTYLNHGGFGACPRPVLEAYQGWQRELEREPTDFLQRRLDARLAVVREELGAFLGARADDLALVPNSTSGLNAAIRSLDLAAGDEVLATAHEYGALVKTWEATGVRLVVHEPEELAEAIGPRTRVVFLSQVTSATATELPVAATCAAARAAGVLSVVDGAHAPGHVPLDLASLGADVYVGTCHKWLCAPKGAAFLWARPEHQRWIEPVVTSWGWAPGAGFAAKHEWQGTFDPAAWLSIPAAIEAWRALDLGACRELAARGRERLPPLPGTPAPQMWSTELPPGDPGALWTALRDRYRIEVPVLDWAGRRLLRVSIGPYNVADDLDRLLAALDELL
jgi:isopenicillin-N epimerase